MFPRIRAYYSTFHFQEPISIQIHHSKWNGEERNDENDKDSNQVKQYMYTQKKYFNCLKWEGLCRLEEKSWDMEKLSATKGTNDLADR